MRSDYRADRLLLVSGLRHTPAPHPLQKPCDRQAADVPDQQRCLSAITITELYRCRWQVELFFKWIKQHLCSNVLFGTSDNAVKPQLWIAVSAYVLVALAKKRLNLSARLYEMQQILSLTLFERIPLDTLLHHIITDDIQAFRLIS